MNTNEPLLQLQELPCQSFKQPLVSEFYNIFLLEGSGTISIDFVDYTYSGKIALFTSPYQHITIVSDTSQPVRQLAFHGDFYCIEYHKQEVACNGLLFNNIYKQPFIPLPDNELYAIFDKILHETALNQPYSEPILRTYLQLILAIGSRIKRQQQDLVTTLPPQPIEQFRELLELHFINHRNTDFYAAELAMAPATFAKKCKKYFGKSPLQLLQERVVLEAKKQLHLTHKSVKEVAAALNFSDEHYFSRFFKNHTGVSPTGFRVKVGISIVADLSMR